LKMYAFNRTSSAHSRFFNSLSISRNFCRCQHQRMRERRRRRSERERERRRESEREIFSDASSLLRLFFNPKKTHEMPTFENVGLLLPQHHLPPGHLATRTSIHARERLRRICRQRCAPPPPRPPSAFAPRRAPATWAKELENRAIVALFGRRVLGRWAIRLYTYIHTYVYTYINTYLHTYTHTHTHTPACATFSPRPQHCHARACVRPPAAVTRQHPRRPRRACAYGVRSPLCRSGLAFHCVPKCINM
jgi:hypothetical protein